MNIIKHINSFHTSNSYILESTDSSNVWIIDPGDSDFIINWLTSYHKTIKGVLLTHSHYDHIYGLNDLLDQYDNFIVYASENCRDGLFDSRLNLSEYLEMPYTVKTCLVNILLDGVLVKLWDNMFLKAIFTPGHNEESFSFHVENDLFTGDAFIPNVRVFTKFKGGDRKKAQITIKKIFRDYPLTTIIHPGHEEDAILSECKIIL